jgi:ribosomal protein S18 acetylase RimI-like enzyme
MNEIHVRRGTPADAAVVADFNIRMALETESHVLDPDTVDKGVLAALSDENRALYFVAEINGRVVGQTMVTHEWSDWRNGDVWWLQSVYVHPDSRGRGVFRALHAEVERSARAARAVGLRLYVWNENVRAQATYGKLGWVDGNYRVMERMFPSPRGADLG